jgi:hypothetical protein
MSQATVSPQGALVRSYLFLRRSVGVIGIALPVVLIVGKLIVDGGGLLGSISGYYYTDLRDVWVGSMCAVGVFLFSYRGYSVVDEIAGNIAAGAAIGLALCPTTPAQPVGPDKLIGTLHLVFAGIFFLSLAFFCLFLFTKTDAGAPTGRKLQRNRVYVVSGVVIVACLVLIALQGVLFASSLHPALWLESAAILAFGVAWLTKGEALLGD